jgi:hypothetical protein
MQARFLEEPRFAALFRYWNTIRGPREMPARRDLDPVALGSALLPHVAIIELGEAGSRPRFRLVGTEIVQRFGREFTGRYLEEFLSGSYLAHLTSLYRELWLRRCPIYEENVFRWSEMRHVWAKRFVLPLTGTGSDPEFAVGAQLFMSHIEERAPLREALSSAEIDRLSIDYIDPAAVTARRERLEGG